MDNRYSKITNKNRREIVLLKGKPCIYGKCSFCNYIEDNSLDEELNNRINIDVLSRITGEYGALEVINSGSVFELPLVTLEKIREVVYEKNIKILWFEAYYIYKNRLEEMREFFRGVEVRYKVGIETFDENLRNDVLNKDLYYGDIRELSDYFENICLMVGIFGQTEDMIRKDIEIGLSNFKRLTINVFIDNGTSIKRDNNLCNWFIKEFSYLETYENVEILNDNKDFGVYEQ